MYHFGGAYRVILIVFQLILCSLEGKASFLHQVINDTEMFHIFFGEHSVPFFVFMGFDNVELLLPKADERRVHIEHSRKLSDAVI